MLIGYVRVSKEGINKGLSWTWFDIPLPEGV